MAETNHVECRHLMKLMSDWWVPSMALLNLKGFGTDQFLGRHLRTRCITTLSPVAERRELVNE